MWLKVNGKHLINLDHVMEIKATFVHGKSALQAILPNGETLVIREYDVSKEAESMLDQLAKALEPTYSV
ncbi:MAG TPA: hypothetical protein VJM82_02065 [Nitrospiraceae bacterium]|nr:hypothetical protein [Nitrospiraceae bacterium]